MWLQAETVNEKLKQASQTQEAAHREIVKIF